MVFFRFEIINAEGKYPTIVMAPAASGSALTEETDKSSGGSAASGRNLQLASSIGSRHYDLTGANGRTGKLNIFYKSTFFLFFLTIINYYFCL